MCVFLCMLFACTLQRVWPRGARNSLLPARQWRRPKARLKNHLVDINGGQDFFPNFECYYRVFRCKKRLIYKYIYTILYSEYMYIRTHTHTQLYAYTILYAEYAHTVTYILILRQEFCISSVFESMHPSSKPSCGTRPRGSLRWCHS